MPAGHASSWGHHLPANGLDNGTVGGSPARGREVVRCASLGFVVSVEAASLHARAGSREPAAVTMGTSRRGARATRTLGRSRCPYTRAPRNRILPRIPDPRSWSLSPTDCWSASKGRGVGKLADRSGMRRSIAAPTYPPSKATRASGAAGTSGTGVSRPRGGSSPFTSKGGGTLQPPQEPDRRSAPAVPIFCETKTSSESGCLRLRVAVAAWGDEVATPAAAERCRAAPWPPRLRRHRRTHP